MWLTWRKRSQKRRRRNISSSNVRTLLIVLAHIQFMFRFVAFSFQFHFYRHCSCQFDFTRCLLHFPFSLLHFTTATIPDICSWKIVHLDKKFKWSSEKYEKLWTGCFEEDRECVTCKLSLDMGSCVASKSSFNFQHCITLYRITVLKLKRWLRLFLVKLEDYEFYWSEPPQISFGKAPDTIKFFKQSGRFCQCSCGTTCQLSIMILHSLAQRWKS